MERAVEEKRLSAYPEDINLDYLCAPRYYNEISSQWQELAVRGLDVISAVDLLQKVHKITKGFPVQCPIFPQVHHIIMDVAIQQRHPSKAPAIAQELLDMMRTEAQTSERPFLEPGVSIYNRLLFAWGRSGRKEAVDEMNDLLEIMRERLIDSDEDTYEAFEELNRTAEPG